MQALAAGHGDCYINVRIGPVVLKTKLSSKGQVMPPKSLRDSHRWPAGTEFMVEDTADGVLLRLARPFAPARIEQLAGCRRGSGPTRTLEEMNQAVDAELRDRRDRGQY